MPTEKRARQRAGRQARREAIARRQKRRRQARSSVVVVIVAAIVIGSVYLITHRSPQSFPNTAQGRLEAIWSKAGCPTNPHTRVNNLSYSSAPKLTISEAATYEATVKTDVGTFVITLNPKESPVAANSFEFLAKHGFYNCLTFHRVVTNFVDQTGDPTGTGTGGAGYRFAESGPAAATPQYPLGAVVLANADPSAKPKTNGSQFYVVAGPAGESLPPDYVLFGQVTSGMSVIRKINKDGSAGETGTPKVYHRMLSVTIKET